jgi:hypothetical protein
MYTVHVVKARWLARVYRPFDKTNMMVSVENCSFCLAALEAKGLPWEKKGVDNHSCD